ncbi:MAG TPA: ABC transporter substrate-binding protein [Albitalea sp.]|nr:ABC transporter substrate-binding protein [Albitalea sp.]
MTTSTGSVHRAMLAAACIALALPAAAAPAARIGVILPQTWPDKARGDDMRDGMLLALQTTPGQTATLVVKDSACDGRKAAAAAKELIDAQVDVVVGGFCVLGSVPKQLREAAIPFVSANAERLMLNTEGLLQLGEVPVSLADTIAARLRTETDLRVTASSACWIDFDPKMPDGYDAVLCPTLQVNGANWDDVAPAFSAAYRKPFSVSAARGYAAMQAALAALKQSRASVKPAKAKAPEAKDIETMLGKVRFREERPTPEDAMVLRFSSKLPRLAPKQKAKLDEVMKSKACGCTQAGTCGPATAWSAMPFVVANGNACGLQGLVIRR